MCIIEVCTPPVGGGVEGGATGVAAEEESVADGAAEAHEEGPQKAGLHFSCRRSADQGTGGLRNIQVEGGMWLEGE